jgi:hypothetical protein
VVIPNDLELGSEFYRNIDHLNARGAKVVSRDLLDTLVNL